MLDTLIEYVLPKDQYEDLNEPQRFRRPYLRAKESFVKALHTGEPGELLLFLLLEADGVVRLFSKMNLKTNPNVHYHGYDAVHLQVDQNIMFHFGHAKMHADFAGALNEVMSDVRNFDEKGMKETELNLVSSYLDEKRFEGFADTIKNLINPYSSDRSAYAEANSVYIGSNWPFMKHVSIDDETKLDDHMRNEWEKQQEGISSTVKNKVASTSKVNSQAFFFYIMPFVDVQEFRSMFLKELAR
jgi:hypothetical protein